MATTAAATSPPTPASDYFELEFWEKQLENLGPILSDIALRLLFALFVLFIGWIVIKIILWVIRKLTSRFDQVIVDFCLSIVKFFLWMMLIMMVLDVLKIELVSMGAIVAALAFGVGLAVGDFAANLIGGVLILAYKHFSVGDYIEGGGVSGSVKEIGMTRCILKTPDNKICIVPNQPLAMGIVTNYSKQKTRRVDLMVGVAYDADLAVCRKVFESLCKKHPLVLEDPGTVVNVHELGDSSVNFCVRPWVMREDYWTVYWELTEQIKRALDKKDIGIPFPQIDAHIFRQKPSAGNDNKQQQMPGETTGVDMDGNPISDETPGGNDTSEKPSKKSKAAEPESEEEDEYSYEEEDDEDEYEYEYETESEPEPEPEPKKKSSKKSKK